MMAYAASPRVYLQRFPAQDARDRTNKFGVSFNNVRNLTSRTIPEETCSNAIAGYQLFDRLFETATRIQI